VKGNKFYLTTLSAFFLITLYPIFADDSENMQIEVFTDKSVYTNGDFITITGSVSEKIDDTAMIIVFDPFGNPVGIYPAVIDSDNKFHVEFLAKAGVNFKIDGTYSINANYAEIKNTILFDFFKTSSQQENPVDEDNEEIEITQDISETTKDENENNKSSNEVEEKNNDENQNEKTVGIIPQEIILEKPIDKNTEQETFDNLSVDDIKLGEMLNRIYLDCDDSKIGYDVLYYDGMGPSLTRLCKYQEALPFYDETLIEDSKNIEALTNKGTVLSKLGQYDKALIFYNAALYENSEYVPALNNKANVLYQMENFEQAAVLYQQVLKIEPTHNFAQNSLAQINEINFNNDDNNSHDSLPNNEKDEQLDPTQNNQDNKKSSNIFEQINNAIASFFKNFF